MPKATQAITRELLYTAVTRARARVTIHAAPEIVKQAVVQRVEQRSGLQGLTPTGLPPT